MRKLAFAVSLTLLALAVVVDRPLTAQARGGAAPAGPILQMETVKGQIQIRLFPNDAPRSVEQILGLVKRNFYRGLRIHRAETSLVQFGDPTTRDMSRQDYWGRSGSGRPIGVSEINKRTHVRGTVSLAHGGDARSADSQMFIMKTASPSLNGKHAVIGQVTSGMDVVDRLGVGDMIRNITLTTAAP
jgi:cyclophilin family peptidyl-prolyl cis-trans isomerase